MLSVLIDNSTLTAVQRLTGDIPVAFSFPTEGDLSAFDQYVRSLLVYDEIAAIDDYKEEYQSDRLKFFKEVRFLKPSNIPYQSAIDESTKSLADVAFQIQRGSIKHGPLNDLLCSLDLHVAPAWYMQSSDWFLRMRLLASEANINLPKYGALMTAIRDQSRENLKSQDNSSAPLRIEDRRGAVINLDKSGDGSVEDDIKAFATSLNWIAHRSVFYLSISRKMECALSLHPIRHQYAAQYILREERSDIRAEVLRFFQSGVTPIRDESDTMLGMGAFRMNLPFFAGWAVGYAGNPRDGYDHVLQVRNSSACQQLRAHFRQIDDALNDGDTVTTRTALAKLRSAITDDLARLSVKFQGRKPNTGLGISINALTLTPSISIPSAFDRIRSIIPSPSKNSALIFKNISAEMMASPTFGNLSDMFSASRKYGKGTGLVPEKTRTELFQYRNSKNSFKNPL